MTMLWAAIFAIILLSAVARARRRSDATVHPYADKAPLPSASPRETHVPVQGRARVPELAR
jgi:hypothetical protein